MLRNPSRSLAAATLLCAGALFTPIAASAQDQLQFPAPSPNAKVVQTVGLTEIEIDYARPAMRGREIFGGLVQLDSIWRTGANASTKISFSGDVVFGGTEVAAGTYALYTVPSKGDWEVILSSKTDLWGSYGYTGEGEVARVSAAPEELANPVESLTISLDDVVDDRAVLNIAWENMRVPVIIEADTQAVLIPQIKAVMASDAEEKPYFQAAMYVYSKGVMLEEAAEWISKAAEAQPNAFWLTYRQGLVLAAIGDYEGALAAAEKSLAVAEKQQGEIKAEYTRLNEALIARAKAAM